MAERWVITTSDGEIDVTHLSPEQRQETLAKIRINEMLYRAAVQQTIRNLRTPLFKKNRR